MRPIQSRFDIVSRFACCYHTHILPTVRVSSTPHCDVGGIILTALIVLLHHAHNCALNRSCNQTKVVPELDIHTGRGKEQL